MPKLMFVLFLISVCDLPAMAQLGIPKPSTEQVIVRPKEINDVLNNPGIGFSTFQRFNGDALNAGTGWTEGHPIEYQEFDGDLTNPDYPATTTAYFRVYWRYVEPEPGRYNWPMLDKALKTAAERGQTLCLRIATYAGGENEDVPDWYRKLVGPEPKLASDKWRTDPENPNFVRYFGGMIRALGERYDGHPDLEWVDVSVVGFWGEGDGSHLLSDSTRLALLNSYLDSFKKTHLIFQPLNGDAPAPGLLVRGTPIAAYWPDGSSNGDGSIIRHLGWRGDCIGDMGFWRAEQGDWCHMYDLYPQDIVRAGMSEAWRRAPIAHEICGTFGSWQQKQGYDAEKVKYIFDQALKWHVSTFNAKSSAVPAEWRPLVDEWLKRMGYRFVLRKFSYPAEIRPHGKLAFRSWWENKGVAPAYREWPLAIRLKNSERTEFLPTDADVRTWLPGDVIYDSAVFLPVDLPEGQYELEIAIVEPRTRRPHVRLAIEGRQPDGWYRMGSIRVRENR